MKCFFTLLAFLTINFSYCSVVTLDLSVLLEGPYAPGHSELMYSNPGSLPYNQPFNQPLPYYGNSSPYWHYQGQEYVQVMPQGAVDWVLLEIRDAQAASVAYRNTAMARQAALLLEDGSIVNINGQAPEFNLQIMNNLFIVIYHRNHLPVMSSEPLTQTAGVYSWDFTQGAHKAYGMKQKQLGEGIFGMIGGDGNADGQIHTQDKNDVWQVLSGLSGYHAGDFDLNGQVQLQDINEIWKSNAGQASPIPTGVAGGVPCPDLPYFIDPRDGNIYHTVLLGNQCWLKNNLKYLPSVYPPNSTSNFSSRYYVYAYNGNNVSQAKATDNYQHYGVLYNYTSAANACPAGWHLPSNNEWSQLVNYLMDEYGITNNEDDVNALANKLKSCRQADSPLEGNCNTLNHPRWDSSEHFGTDEFNFNALPAGALNPDDSVFDFLGMGTAWWTSSGLSWPLNSYGYLWGMAYLQGSVYNSYYLKGGGASVRCIKD